MKERQVIESENLQDSRTDVAEFARRQQFRGKYSAVCC